MSRNRPVALLVALALALCTVLGACAGVPPAETFRLRGVDAMEALQSAERQYHESIQLHADLRRAQERDGQELLRIEAELRDLADRGTKLAAEIERGQAELREVCLEPSGLSQPPRTEPASIFYSGDELYHSSQLDLARSYFVECLHTGSTSYDYDILSLFRVAAISERLRQAECVCWAVVELDDRRTRLAGREELLAELGRLEAALPRGSVSQAKAVRGDLLALRSDHAAVGNRHSRLKQTTFLPLQRRIQERNRNMNYLAAKSSGALEAARYAGRDIEALLAELEATLEDVNEEIRPRYENVLLEVAAWRDRSTVLAPRAAPRPQP